MSSAPASTSAETSPRAPETVLAVLLAISVSHLLNDTIQSLIPAVYPVIKDSYHLSYTQIGLITFAFQLTASLLQPFVGAYTDRKPQPFSLAIGMGFSLIGLVLLAKAASFPVIVGSAALVGVGSSIFHPEASRLAHLASGGRTGLAQSIFQVGGNLGSSLGPLLAALIVVPRGQAHILWFSGVALLGIIILSAVGRWYRENLHRARPRKAGTSSGVALSAGRVRWSIAILLTLIFSKHFYLASMGSYYTFFVIKKFHLSVQASQMLLFLFLFAVAAGTMIGGPIGDRIGRKYVIWGSILGVAPFSLLLPYANLFWTGVLSVIIGVILASAFSAILVYATELMPGRVGTIAGLFFGFGFGIAGIASAVLGKVADLTSIEFVFHICAFLPLIGLLTAFLPDVRRAPNVS